MGMKEGKFAALIVGILLLHNVHSIPDYPFQDATVDQGYDCPTGWDRLGLTCSKAYATGLTWEQARDTCRGLGGFLARIDSVNSNYFVGDAVKAVDTSGSDGFWIGMNRHMGTFGNESMAVWEGETTQTSTYEGFWDTQQPDVVKGDCVAMSNKPAYPWRFEWCQKKLPFACNQVACLKNSFKCANGKCIQPSLQCNGRDDCGDQSDELSCPDKCRYHLTADTGNFKTPDNPGNYPIRKNCQWTIEVPVGKKVVLQFSQFNTESREDPVQIWVGGKTIESSSFLAELSGALNVAEIPKFVSTNNFMIVTFSSDNAVVQAGFQASFNTNFQLTGVDQETQATTALQPLAFTAAQYYSGIKVYWVLKASQVIFLQMDEWNMESMDKMEVYDGPDATGGKLAEYKKGMKMHQYVFSTKNSMYITLETRSIKIGQGFSFKYKAGCDATLNEDSGVFYSPGYTANVEYPTSITCTYTVKLKTTTRKLSVIFEGEIAGGDTITVYNGEQEDAAKIAKDMTSVPDETGLTDATAYIKFQSLSAAGTRTGFRARFSMNCEERTIGSPLMVTDGTYSSYFSTHNFSVSCASGFEFGEELYEGKDKLMYWCKHGGMWNNPYLPICMESYCGPVPAINNGYIVNSTGVRTNDTAFYTCFEGNVMTGTPYVTCLLDGKWSSPPVCSSNDCPAPPTVNNGEMNITHGNGSDFGSIVMYTCDEGYIMAGVPTVVCMNGGMWSSSPPTCNAVYCAPPKITWGKLDSAPAAPYSFNTSVMIACNSGYGIMQNGTIEPCTGSSGPECFTSCGSDGNFVDVTHCMDIDECAMNTCGCNQGCKNKNGTCECYCWDGYEFKSGSTQECVDIDECALMNGGCEQNCHNFTGTYNCSCNEGYELFTTNGQQGYQEKQKDGKWPILDHSCVKMTCPTPPAMVNGLSNACTSKSYRFMDTVMYMCNLGYVINGTVSNNTHTIHCIANGTWNEQPPVCVLAMCDVNMPTIPYLPVLSNNNSAVYKEVVTATCDVPGGSVVTKNTQCLYHSESKTYKLLKDSLICPEITCGTPPGVGGQSAPAPTNTDKYKSQYNFTCSSSAFTQEGASSLTSAVVNTWVECQSNGKWSIGTLTCSGPVCTDPGTPPGGKQITPYTYEVGFSVMYSCDRDGFMPNDTKPLICELTGSTPSWNGTVPACYDVTKPVIKNCPTKPYYVLKYDTVTIDPPLNFTDNSGAVASVEWSFDLREPIISDMTVTASATDHFGNIGVCSVEIKVRDETPPLATCPATYVTYELTSAAPRTINLASSGWVSNSTGNSTTAFHPETITVSIDDLNTAKTVEVTVSDEQGNSGDCLFQVYIQAPACSPWTIPTPANANAPVCYPGAEANCTVTCNAGHHFPDGSSERVYKCGASTSNKWSPAKYQDCEKSEAATYRYTVRLKYNGAVVSQECVDGYKANFIAEAAAVSNGLTTRCRSGPGAPQNIYVKIKEDTIVMEPRSENIFVLMSAEVGPPSLEQTQLDLCVAFFLEPSIKNIGAPYAAALDPIEKMTTTVAGGGCIEFTVDNTGFEKKGLAYVCPSGKVSKKDGDVGICLSCPKGTKFDTTTKLCADCPAGEFQNMTGQTECRTCDSGFDTYSTGSEKCTAQCGKGLSSANGLPPCNGCAENTFWAGPTNCSACPNSEVTRKIGAKDISECLGKCAAGQVSYSGDEPCRPCPKGFHAAGVGNTECTPCTSSETTPTPGAVAGGACTTDGVCTNTTCMYGSCSIVNHLYNCSCDPGYTGIHCETLINPCDSSPCYHGGSCNLIPGVALGYNCSCTTREKCNVTETVDYLRDEPVQFNKDYFVDIDAVKCKVKCDEIEGCKEAQYTPAHGSTPQNCKLYRSYLAPGGNYQVNKTGYVLITKKCSEQPEFIGERCETIADACPPDWCFNGGMCKLTAAGPECLCNTNGTYEGRRCEIVGDPCVLKPCNNSGTCESFGGVRRQCHCTDGWTGDDCSDDVDECSSDPCLNDGECINEPGTNAYTCKCKEEYTGTQCETLKDLCSGNRCGTVGVQSCTVDYMKAKPMCICEQGYSSEYYWTEWFDRDDPTSGSSDNETVALHGYPCKMEKAKDIQCRVKGSGLNHTQTGDDIRHCDASRGLLCVNRNDTHDVCSDYEVRYKCPLDQTECKPINPCAPGNVCKHGGACSNPSPGVYQCACLDGYSGMMCETNINECASNPCENGGDCEDQVNMYNCKCKPGYTGMNCEVNIDDCVNNTCSSVGTERCEDGSNMYKCICKAGYSGTECEVDIDECAEETTLGRTPCLNNGNCTNEVGKYSCSCAPGWEGDHCEKVISSCSPGPCQSSAPCYDLLNKAYCSCYKGSYGETCSFSPDTCAVADPCVSGRGTCVIKEGQTTCNCIPNAGWGGGGCELIKSKCEAATCQNGATCIQQGSGASSCICAEGFTGADCSSAINPTNSPITSCTGINCNAGTCFADPNGAFCICNAEKVGEFCNKDVDTDNFIQIYTDMGGAIQRVPFLQNSTSFTFWFLAKYFAKGSTGTFIRVYRMDTPTSDEQEFMEVSETGVKIKLPSGEKTVSFATNSNPDLAMNNGKGHRVAFVYDDAKDEFHISYDTSNEAIVSISDMPELKYLKIQIGAKRGEQGAFRGAVGQVSMWDKALVKADLDKIFSNILSVPLGETAAWGNYELYGGTERVYGLLPPSDFTVPDITCPADMRLYQAGQRSQIATWTSPNIKPGETLSSNYQSGHVFEQGEWEVIHTAWDPENDTDTCSFKIYVQYSDCPDPSVSTGITQTCGMHGDFKACEPKCDAGKAFLEETPKYVTCGPSGIWNRVTPSEPFQYAKCGEEFPAKAKMTLYMVYEGTCTDVIKNRVGEHVHKKFDSTTKSLCTFIGASCESTIKAGVTCLNNKPVVSLLVDVPPSVTVNGTELRTVDYLKQEILQASSYDLDNADAVVIDSTVIINGTIVCNWGEQVVGDQCVECPAGTYFHNNTEKCLNCPKGTYQNEVRKPDCISCGSSKTTVSDGSDKSTDCLDECPVGQYYDSIKPGCVLCDDGFYQNMTGQTTCFSCPADKTTPTNGSTSIDQCTVACPSGQQMLPNGTCQYCELGWYRDATINKFCEKCPGNKLTPSTGATSQTECTVDVCEAGTYRYNDTSCAPCAMGSYQPEKNKNTCIDCGTGFGTDGTGKTSLQDCIVKCPAGEEIYNRTNCVKCKQNYYREASATLLENCTECANSQTTVGLGSTSVTDCYGHVAIFYVKFVMTAEVWVTTLQDHTSTTFITMKTKIINVFDKILKAKNVRYIRSSVFGFLQGSVVAEAGIAYSPNQTTEKQIEDALKQDLPTEIPHTGLAYTSVPLSALTCTGGECYCTISGASVDTTSGNCKLCPEGQYRYQEGATTDGVCTKCPDGTSTSGAGQVGTEQTVCKDACKLDLGYCSGAGDCFVKADKTKGCTCKEGFQGTRCTVRTLPPKILPWIIGGSIGGAGLLLLLLLLGCCCYRYCFGGRKVVDDRRSYPPPEQIIYPPPPQTVVSVPPAVAYPGLYQSEFYGGSVQSLSGQAGPNPFTPPTGVPPASLASLRPTEQSVNGNRRYLIFDEEYDDKYSAFYEPDVKYS